MTSLEAYRLRVYSSKLDDVIGDEVKKRVPDVVKLTRLKKLRLLIKDKIASHLRQRRLA
jgi:uncharacterized protein YdcH (DUF465 family)